MSMRSVSWESARHSLPDVCRYVPRSYLVSHDDAMSAGWLTRYRSCLQNSSRLLNEFLRTDRLTIVSRRCDEQQASESKAFCMFWTRTFSVVCGCGGRDDTGPALDPL